MAQRAPSHIAATSKVAIALHTKVEHVRSVPQVPPPGRPKWAHHPQLAKAAKAAKARAAKVAKARASALDTPAWSAPPTSPETKSPETHILVYISVAKLRPHALP